MKISSDMSTLRGAVSSGPVSDIRAKVPRLPSFRLKSTVTHFPLHGRYDAAPSTVSLTA